jgi:heme A synthase
MSHHYHTLANGATGILASVGTVLTTFQTQLEWWVRMTGSIIGLIIAVISLYNLIKKSEK